MAGFELVEHTADVGIRVRAPSLAATIEEATRGLAEVAGVGRPGTGDAVAVEVEAGDPGAVLVDWLNEVLYLLEVRASALAGVSVRHAGAQGAAGSVSLSPLDYEVEGTPVKAATYHQLDVRREGRGWVATVYLDI